MFKHVQYNGNQTKLKYASQSLRVFFSDPRRGIIISPKKKRQKCHVVSSQLAMDVRLLRAAETSSTNVAPFIEREVHVFANYAQVW